jgi:hypothetical protein
MNARRAISLLGGEANHFHRQGIFIAVTIESYTHIMPSLLQWLLQGRGGVLIEPTTRTRNS